LTFLNLTFFDLFAIVEEIAERAVVPTSSTRTTARRYDAASRRFAEVGGLVPTTPNRSTGWEERAGADSPHGASAAGTVSIVLAGLLAAIVIAFLLRPPIASRLSFTRSVLAAAGWIAVTALAGTAGMVLGRIAVRRRAAWAVSRPALAAAAGWILIPPLLLLSWRGSDWTLLYAGCAAAALALALRELHPAPDADSASLEETRAMPFAQLPPPDSKPRQSFLISAFLQGAIVCLFRRSLFMAAVLAALASFLFAWKVASAGGGRCRPAARTAIAALLALFILIPLLVRPVQMVAAGGGDTSQAKSARPRDSADDYAWQGIILFTVPQKEVVLPPAPQQNPLRPGSARPLIIPFDGSYWYFQAPRHGPGLHAHIAQGDPVALSIYSTDWIPLAMQAHQTLPRPVDLTCCNRLDLTLRNGDNRAGEISVGMLLTDSTLPGKPSVYLAVKPIVSTEPDHFSVKSSPVEEDVTFTMPPHPPITNFDEITVLFFPAVERSTLGARVGIRQFELLPR
jgi:hypothetical protein